MSDELERHLEAFRRGCVEVIDEKELAERLRSKQGIRPLRVKFGMDPSSPDLHVGHAVVLRKLRDLQDLGHTIILLVGETTAMVGDPSGRNKLRPQLSRDEVRANMQTYIDQAAAILDPEKTEVRYNSEWFDKMNFGDVIRLAGRMTVAQMIERDTFDNRMKAEEPIGIHEFLYPLMQGWDSVELEADVEYGGSDQTFNLLVGRDMQRQEGQPPQIIATLPLLLGLDGRKMSKSYGNAIGLTDAPKDVFGKTMSIDDDSMESWYLLLTRLPESEYKPILAGHPREAKARLAWELCAFLHGEEAANAAREAFDQQFKHKERPTDIPEFKWPGGEEGLPLANLLRDLELLKSSSEVRNRVKGKGVKILERGGQAIEDELVEDPMLVVGRGDLPMTVRFGKRNYARIV